MILTIIIPAFVFSIILCKLGTIADEKMDKIFHQQNINNLRHLDHDIIRKN